MSTKVTANELLTFPNFKAALRASVERSHMTREWVANHLSVSTTQPTRWCDPQDPTQIPMRHFLSLLPEFTDCSVLGFLAKLCRHVVHPQPTATGVGAASAASTMREFAAWLDRYGAAVEDGVLTAAEVEDLDAYAWRAQAAIAKVQEAAKVATANESGMRRVK